MANIVIDPDAGWRYGFPKVISLEEYGKAVKDINQWFIDNGYPKTQVEYWANSDFGQVPYRTWVEG